MTIIRRYKHARGHNSEGDKLPKLFAHVPTTAYVAAEVWLAGLRELYPGYRDDELLMYALSQTLSKYRGHALK